MLKEKTAWWVVIGAVIYYIILFSAYSILLQLIFHTQAFDSGIDDQGIWLLSRFLNPFVTVRGMNLFGDSVTLYHFVFVPFFWLWNNINILYIFQSFFLGIGAIPLFLFAREKLKNNFLAVAVGLSYLLYPALQNLNLDQFHSESITVFFFIMTLYYLLKNNFKLFYIFFIISLLGKDEVALTGLFIGLFLLLSKKELRHGFMVIGLSVVWYLLCSRVFMPIFNGIGIFDPQPITYSHWFRGLMSNLFNWRFYLENIFHVESLQYYFNLLSPLAFIPLAGWQILFLIIPSVAVNVLSGTGYLRSVSYHYNYIQTAVIFFALIEGLALIKQKKFLGKDSAIFLGVIVLVCSLTANIILSHLPVNKHWSLVKQKLDYYNGDRNQARLAALKLIPKEAKVSASYSIVPHLSHRQEIYMFPNPFWPTIWNQWFQEGKGCPSPEGHVEYLVIDQSTLSESDKAILYKIQDQSNCKQLYGQEDFLIFRLK